MPSSNNNNEPVKRGAASALNRFKTEVANELGLANYEQVDKGNLTSRQNGYVGGNMTKKMVAFAEQALQQGLDANIGNSARTERPNNYNAD
ncbi:MAG: small, acid-soluble spore protein, alpha/beta type [Bacillota bacterium]